MEAKERGGGEAINPTRLMRARINDRLARAARYPVTLIVAPAGFGKTVALRDFVETSRLEAVRCNVGRDDGTLLTFAYRLSEALEPAAPTVLAAFAAMQQRLLSSDQPARRLADWFAEHLKRTICTVVVDDLHYAHDSAIALLAEVIERTGDRIKWIIATRSDAGIPVASWIAYGRMDLPLGEDDLRFTDDEALAAADEAQAGIENDEVLSLRGFTEGWPVALAIALRTRTHASDLRSAAAGTREMVYRYLAEQVFTGLAHEEQAFLLETSVFSAFDVGIGEALGHSAEFVARVRQSVAFVTTVSPGEYRYHDLFREYLESELRARGEPIWQRALIRAGGILEARGDAVSALQLYVKAGETAAILRMVERSGLHLFERGQLDVLSAALQSLSADQRGSNATAIGLSAMLEAARGRFEIAERDFTAAIAAAPPGELRLALVHRYAIELVRHDRDCAALLEPYANDRTLPALWRVPVLGTLATTLVRAERIAEAITTIERALELLDAGASDEVRARLHQQAAYVYQFSESRERARTFAQMAVDLALACDLCEVAARAYSVLYTLAYDEDDPIALLGILDKLGECARKGGTNQVRVFGLIATYEIEAERGNEPELDRLERALGESPAILPRTRAESLLPALALRAAWRSEFARAYELLQGTVDPQAPRDRRALRRAEIAVYAFAAGFTEAGEAMARDAAAALDGSGVGSRRSARTQLTLALAELAGGRPSAAYRHITSAERQIGPAMRRLRAFAHAIRNVYCLQLEQTEPATLAAALERMRSEHLGGVARLIERLPLGSLTQQGYALLTPSERAILWMLVKGASTKDVAAQTERSPQTIDTHIRSICRKLQCSGRREAVALAVGEGWIE